MEWIHHLDSKMYFCVKVSFSLPLILLGVSRPVVIIMTAIKTNLYFNKNHLLFQQNKPNGETEN